MKRKKFLINRKYTIYLNTLLFVVIMGCDEKFEIDIPFFLLWLFTLFFILSIFVEFKGYKKENPYSFKIHKYEIVGIERIFVGAMIIMLLGKEVMDKDISFIMFFYGYIFYLFLGIRFFKHP